MINTIINNKGNIMIECPICKKHFNSLITHLFYKHNLTVSEFKKIYPSCLLQIGISHENEEYFCPYCNKKFSSKNGLGTHISYVHKGLERGSKKNKVRREHKEGIKCEICGNTFINIKQHIEIKHLMKWEDYCKTYNYNGLEKYCSEKTKSLLSQNKKKFYDSDRGTILKQIQSENMIGDKNFAKKAIIREKISKSRIGREMTFVGFGIYFDFNLFNKHYIARSFNEFKAIISLIENNIDFTYENVYIMYKDIEGVLRNHITDFVIDNTIYELKPYSEIKIKNNDYKSFDKYKNIKEYAEKVGYNFNVVNNRMLETMLNIPHKPDNYYHNLVKEMVDNNSMNKIVVNRSSKSNFLTFVEKIFTPDNTKIIIRRY